jgi:hypothetical protein
MKKTRRAFGLSGFGFGAALAGSAGLGRSREGHEPRTVRLHEDTKRSCLEVSLARGGDSEVFATFARAQPGSEVGDILLVRSGDGGVTWQKATSAPLFSNDGTQQGNGGYQHAALTRLGDGALLAATTKFGFLFGGEVGWRRGSQIDGVYVRASSDGGSTWGEVRNVGIEPFRRAWTRGPIVEMQDGSLLLPLAGQRGDRYSDVHEPISSFLMRSDDRGVSWKFHATIAQDPRGASDYDEAVMVSLGGQRLLCALRSHQAPRRDPPGGYLHLTVSEDGGASWSSPRMSSMWGHPANLLRLADGRVLCTYGYRMHPNPGVRACISRDGVDWQPGDIFTVNSLPDVDGEHLQIGCPSSVELDAGRVLTAYHVWAQASDRQCLEGSLFRV